MNEDHIVKSYDEDLERLDNLIAEMGGLAEAHLADSIDALIRFDTETANRIVSDDRKIDDLESEVDKLAVQVVALRQPMADDLRVVITALKISSNIERIGDYAKNISKRTMTLAKTPAIGSSVNTIARMGGVVQGMIKNVLDAYVARDADKAADVRRRDEEVDQIHSSLFRELLTYMMEDPRKIGTCTHLLFIAKNIERIGDHVTSIAEQIHFMVHGTFPSDDRPKGDSSSFTVVETAGGSNS